MRFIDSALQSALAAGRVVARDMIIFDFPSGIYAFWSGVGKITWNGTVFQGSGALLEIDAVSQASDGSAVPITVKLSAIPNTDLSPDVLTTIEAEFYKGRPVRLYKGYFDAESRVLLSVRATWAGTVDTIDHDYTVGEGYTLTMNGESRALDHQKTGYRVRANADQARLKDGDRFFDKVGTAGTATIDWGRRPSTAKGGGGSGAWMA